jgi:hypothetical protein
MRGTICRLHFSIRFRTRVLVHHRDANRRAQRLPLEDAGEDTALIRFVARRHDLALAGSAPVEIALDIGLAHRQARRATVNDHTDTASMGFTPGGDAEGMAEVAGHFGGC